ncbi:MAG TPA: hemerythrin family protein [Anaeromyxobacter sp.]|nr:hemerythrin family protein [Anaeromyxobacter sp.]
MNQEWTAVACPDVRIDSLRRELLRDAEQLVAAVDAHRYRELLSLAGKLLATAREQFQAEERRLREARAPSLVRHAGEHERFLTDVGSIVALAAQGDTDGVEALRPERFIPDWLSAHARTDRDLTAG